MEARNCKTCNAIKDTCEFYWNKHLARWSTSCKMCISKQNKELYIRQRENIKIKVRTYRAKNLDIVKEKSIIYHNRPEIKELRKKYRDNNRELIRRKEREWRTNNPEEARERARKKNKVQRAKLSNRIRSNISRLVNHALHNANSSKLGRSCLKHLPYTIDQLKQHLESQFESWMTWENWGKYNSKIWNDNDSKTWTWQIDHIIPQSLLIYTNMEEDNFQKSWALENLRPYSAKHNYLDGATRKRHK